MHINKIFKCSMPIIFQQSVVTYTKFSKVLFGKYLLFTNIGISMSSSACGDAIEQYTHIVNTTGKIYNTERTVYMATTGTMIGATCHYWYLWLDAVYQGRSWKCITKKLLLDQILFSPLLWLLFFSSLEILKHKSLEKLHTEINSKGLHLYKTEWFIWPPAQLINFYCLPTHYRVLFDNIVSLCFDTYISHIVHK